MKTIKQHVDDLFKDIPESEKKEIIKQEITENLEEKMRDLMEQGKEEEDAINKTIIEFGDIEEIKNELGIKQPSKRNKAKLNLGFSLWGSALIIALVAFINFYYTPDTIWFVYPTFAVLWWPLSMFHYWLSTK
ncbi:permease prefix domain 1-containing protein [Desmospora activa]|uniref:2TM domain-containing protein n=1 Tax=Desmospora activa DSM 45169 TaxID=1121389 RepID=A0A2T4Z1V4_9BACL|nr:permease prefix domain 1-containing protein [Desmospora activa]PTM54745.1 hypothetical protein C8J48_3397 [Desmospora activa DSM 45169]